MTSHALARTLLRGPNLPVCLPPSSHGYGRLLEVVAAVETPTRLQPSMTLPRNKHEADGPRVVMLSAEAL